MCVGGGGGGGGGGSLARIVRTKGQEQCHVHIKICLYWSEIYSD